jgi:hypothetical protein
VFPLHIFSFVVVLSCPIISHYKNLSNRRIYHTPPEPWKQYALLPNNGQRLKRERDEKDVGTFDTIRYHLKPFVAI